MKRWICSLLLVLGTVGSGWSAGLIIVDEAHWKHRLPPDGIVPPPWPSPRPRPEPWPRPWPVPPPRIYQFCPLEVTRHQAGVRINDQLAATSIEQEFYNPNDQRIEGTFLFPVPKGAQLKKFTMEIDGRPVEAELMSADKARGIYEDIVRKLRDPALLEYAGQDVFKVRIFPIEPRAKKRVSLSYTQLLKSDSGLIGYSYPLNTEKFSAKPIPDVSLKVEVETKRPLKSIYSPSHNLEIKRHGANKATLGYEARNVKPDTDFQIFFAPEADEIGVNLMTYRTGSDDGYFLLLASPGIDPNDKKIVPKDVAFVLDTSGSMAGKKLDQAKKALLFCVENLNEDDHFEIIRFSTEAESLFNKLTAASKENRSRANDFIKELKPIGGTAIDDALRKALALWPGSSRREEAHSSNAEPGTQNTDRKNQSLATSAATSDRPFLVIFLTDGLPTIGNTDENQIVANAKQNSGGNVRVFCFGIGHDVNTHLLDKITEETRAFSQYVLPEEDIEIKVSNFFAKIKDPVLTNPALTFTGDIRATKLYPTPLSDLFRGEQLVLVGRYSGNGASATVLDGMVNGTKKKFTYDVSFSDGTTEYDFIPRLWATRRVGYLLEEIRLHGENAEVKEEVTELARKYSIVTPYTAYLIVEDEARRGVPLLSQTLPQLQEDAATKDATMKYSGELMRRRDGLGPVNQSRSELAFKSANTPADAISAGGAEAQRGFAAAAPQSSAPSGPAGGVVAGRSVVVERVAQYTQQTQFAGGRSFYQNGNQWIDGSVQKLKNPKRVRIQFNSKEYFDLVAKKPETLRWLALGQNVQFALNDTIYEVVDQDATREGKP
jgi:Ca-activated chloride channel homolog